MSNNLVGALLMMASMFSFTVNDTFIKLTNGALPLSQLLTVRGVIATVLMVLLAMSLRGLRFSFGARGWRFIAMRSVTEIGAAYFFLTALLHMPLANVTAVLQVLPLTVTLGAFLVFQEPIGWRRMSAILVGFVGMLLMLRPGTDGFTIWSLYALVAVICVTARDLITRRMPSDVPSLTVATANSFMVAAFFTLSSFGVAWQPITMDLWWLIVGSALFIIGGYFFSVQTMRLGEISFVAPFRYTSLIAALILGWLVFGDFPDGWTLLGAGIVVAAGLFTLWREAQLRER
jgi:S-adenosylmethionine uptake transporter